MKSKPSEFGFHQIQAFEGLDLTKSKLRRLGFYQIQAPEAWISSNPSFRGLDFMNSGLLEAWIPLNPAFRRLRDFENPKAKKCLLRLCRERPKCVQYRLNPSASQAVSKPFVTDRGQVQTFPARPIIGTPRIDDVHGNPNLIHK